MLRKLGTLLLLGLVLAGGAAAQSGNSGTTHVVLTNDQHFTVDNGKFLSGVYECSDGGYIDISCLLGQFPPMNCPAGQAIQSIDSSLNASCISVGAGSGPAGSDTYVQYNAFGVFGADANFTWNYGSSILTLGGGGPGAATFSGTLLASLGSPSDGTIEYCTDCTAATSPCTTGGTGSMAQRLNGAWDCFGGGGSGTVTSVGLSVPSSIFGVTGSPVTTSGTLGITITATSGGIPYFSSTSAMGSSALMTANAFILGGGAGTTPYNTSSSMLWNDTKKAITHTAGTLAAGDAVYNLIGTFATSGTSTQFGQFSNMTSAGSVLSAGQSAMGAFLNAGYTSSGATNAGFFESLVAQAGTDLNLGAATSVPVSDVAIFATSERSGTGAGTKTGGYFSASGSTTNNIGAIGKSVGTAAGTNIGLLGVGNGSTEATDFKSVGGMFVYGSAIVAGFNKNSALVVDGGITPGDYEIVATNGANPVFTLDVQGGITINTGGGAQTGVSATKTVRDAAGSGTCTLIFTSGILTGGSC